MNLNEIKGIGPKTIEHLNKLNIYNIDSLIRYYPYRYNIFTPSKIDETTSAESTIIIPGKIVSEPKISYIKRNFNKVSFQFETEETIINVYHISSGISVKTISKCIMNALEKCPHVREVIPKYINDKYKFLDTYSSIKEIHYPSNTNTLKQARLKLIYEELFEFMFKINLIKYKNQIFDDFIIKELTKNDLQEILNKIPFSLTTDQIDAINDILKDFKNLKRMNRLILGDVGSGKTIVSFIAILLNKKAGFQSALLAPTEVLATQHLNNFTNLFKDIKVGLLVGSLTKKEKENILVKLKNNEIDLLIGTHAMLEDNVEFANIGLVITDEQHRFGVNQRKSLQNKGNKVDVLYMSATPIPRTYALTIYGDMDISYIKEKPAGRKDIITKQYKFKDIKKAVETIEDELKLGYQAYVVAPLIESEEDNELKDLKNIEEI